MKRFSLRTVLIFVMIAAGVLMLLNQYVTYLAKFEWPSDEILVESRRTLTQTELDQLFEGGGERHSAELIAKHPPRRPAYWIAKAKKIESEMTEFALLREIPQASRSTSSSVKGLDVDPSRLLCYAVDSQLAIVVWMSYEQMELTPGTQDSFGRVREVIGFFKHDGQLTKYQTLQSSFTQNLSLADRIPVK